MTTALAPRAGLVRPVPVIAWELHRPDRHGIATAVGYLQDQECARLHGRGRLLHLRIALATRRLQRLVTAAYARPTR